MRIAIMGAGAVGGYFGGLLALHGLDVTFIARGEHLRAMQKNGLTLETPKGSLHVGNARFVANPAEVDGCDVVLFAVKAYDIEAAAAPLKPLVDAGATIISVLNGVDHQDRIGAVVGSDRVLGGLAMVSGVMTAPGVIRYTSPMSSLRFGEADGSASARAIAFRDACVAAGFSAEVVGDIRAAQWTKFVALATNAALTSLFWPSNPIWTVHPSRCRPSRITNRTAADGLCHAWHSAAGDGGVNHQPFPLSSGIAIVSLPDIQVLTA